jgi:hypothetical protein
LPVIFTVLSGPGIINTSPFGVTLTATGTSPITVQVTQAGNANIGAADPVVVTVNPALTVNGGTTLPAGVLNVVYTATRFTASGGKPPYTWTASGLPAGMSINIATGVLSGIPMTAVGSPFAITVTVTDSTSATASAAFSLTVSP